jgi:GTP cyclohydrolase IA
VTRKLRVYAGGAAHLDDEDLPAASPRARRLAARFRDFMIELGLDLGDADLADSPLRVAHAYLEMFAGLSAAAAPRIRTFPNTEGSSQLVSLTDIPFYSLCAHHFLPFFGSVDIAYVPAERIVGLSKLPRIVEFHSRRPQIQERMTEQVLATIVKALRPRAVTIVVRARHLCMEMRGANKPGVLTTTRATHGGIDAA